MTFQYSPYVWPYLVTVGVLAMLASAAWTRRSTSGGVAFTALVVSVAWYALGAGLEYISGDLATAVFWLKVEYVGVAAIPVCWFLFAMRYTGHGGAAARRWVPVLLLAPTLTVVLAWTTDWHGLLWSNARLSSLAQLTLVVKDSGPYLGLHLVFSYTLIVVGMALLLTHTMQSSSVYHAQAFVLGLAALLPLLASVSYVFGLVRVVEGIDYTPLAFGLGAILVWWGMLRYRLLDMRPAARHAIVDVMPDGVIVLDNAMRVVDVNPVAAALLQQPATQLIGRDLRQIMPDRQALIQKYEDADGASIELSVGDESAPRYFQLMLTSLRDGLGVRTGRLVLARDVTARTLAEQRLTYLSTHDPLTGVYNRSHFEDEVRRLEMAGACPVTLLVVDMDELKETNDRLGHAAGDALLQRAATVLSESVGPGALVARIGGDEFVVVLSGEHALPCDEAVARVRQELARHNVLHDGQAVRMSVGAAARERGESLVSVLKLADQDMYADKAQCEAPTSHS